MPRQDKPQQPTRTDKNLEAAFAGESMANRKYLYFAKLARLKGDLEVAELFERTAEEETAHAHAHLSQLYPPDTLTVPDMLRLAMEGELYETNEMYPEFARVARAERVEAAAREMEQQAAESRDHAARFGDALELSERRFIGLAKVEARHAARYAKLLDARRAGDRAAE